MSNPSNPESETISQSETATESNESFGELLSQFEQSHSRKKPGRENRQIEGTVVAITADSVILDIGYKSEGILPLAIFESAKETVKRGDKFLVTIKGRNPEGYYELSRGKVERPTDWESLQKAFNEKATILGVVTGVVKGGLTVDVGVRAFLPASRSGTRDAAEMEKLVGQEIRCRITKIDIEDEDVVVDRRIVSEEEERAAKDRRIAEIKEGDTVSAVVRNVMDYGAFVDLGGVDALLHVSDISWGRVNKPADVLSPGQEVEVKVLKIASEGDKRRISVGMKQLQSHPWDTIGGKYKAGERVRGTVTRLMDFGAFVELEPGIEGLVHVSEMSWAKKVRTPGDVVKPGENVEAVILGVDPAGRKISLGLKQTLGDPWADIGQKFAVGSVIEGPVTNIMKFGAFVQLAEGIEGMIHVSEISAEKRVNHPQDELKVGQRVKAQIIAIDSEKRQMKLSMKQLVPTGLDEYLDGHKEGEMVTGRVMEASGSQLRVELGEGIQASCRIAATKGADEPAHVGAKADVSSLGSMLQARWKSGAGGAESKADAVRAGQIRSFRISRIDRDGKKIELELA